MPDLPKSALAEKLRANEWFRNGGRARDTPRHQRVESWEQAFAYATHEVTKWAALEGGLRLYNQLADINYDRFKEWNSIAGRLDGSITEFVQAASEACEVPTPHASRDWLRGVFIGALMEEEYADCIELHIFRSLTDVVLDGYFPCGWYCRRAADFPNQSPILVY